MFYEIIVGSVVAVVTGLVGLAVWSAKNFKKTKDKAEEIDEVVHTGLRELFKSAIVDIHRNATERGEITIYEFGVFKNLVSLYVKLGGNGVVDHLTADISDLPVKHRK